MNADTVADITREVSSSGSNDETSRPTAPPVSPRIDEELRQYIWQIPAIDNHAHPQGALDAQGQEDQHYLCLACAEMEFRPTPGPTPLRYDNPQVCDAWHKLYGIEIRRDVGGPEIGAVMAARARAIAEKGEDYAAWVLRQLNIEVMLANRIEMIPGLPDPQFRWVSYGDALSLPFNTQCLHNSPDRALYYPMQEKFLQRELGRVGLDTLPETLDLYLSKVVTPVLERQRAEGSIALKFVSAYLRSLDFEKVSRSDAADLYARFRAGAHQTPKEYKAVQDFLVSHMVGEAGRIGLAVHFHTGGGGGQYFYLGGSNPVLLDSILNDPALRDTNIVLIHGAYPWVGEASILSMKPHVYVDFSAQPFLLVPDAMGGILRRWLQYIPEKLLFGTDAVPMAPGIGWEETAWIANNNAREGLAIALTGMLADREITRDRAYELARMCLRDNVAKLYGWIS